MLSAQEAVRSIGNRIADAVMPDFSASRKLEEALKRVDREVDLKRILPPKPNETEHWSLSRAWFTLVIVATLLTSIALCISHFLLGGTRSGLICSVVVWGLMTGGFVIFFAPAKLVTAVVGAIVGASTLSASSGFSGIVSIVDGIAQAMTVALSRLEPVGLSGVEQPFVAALVWIYCGIVLLLCLPAFFAD